MTVDDLFSIFWDAWPKRVARKDARKAFDRAIRTASLETILEGVERYRAGKPEWQDYAHAATWLNGERWADEWENAPRQLTAQQRADMASKVRLHRDDPLFQAIARSRGEHPPTTADGNWYFPIEEVERAKGMAN